MNIGASRCSVARWTELDEIHSTEIAFPISQCPGWLFSRWKLYSSSVVKFSKHFVHMYSTLFILNNRGITAVLPWCCVCCTVVVSTCFVETFTSVTSYWSIAHLLQVPCCMVTVSLLCQLLGTAVKVSVMMFSPCVFCVLLCVTSTFMVSKLAQMIKQASRGGGGGWESFYSCTLMPSGAVMHKVKIHLFLYFFVRPLFGWQFVIRVDGCCANCVVALAFLSSGHTTRKCHDVGKGQILKKS